MAPDPDQEAGADPRLWLVDGFNVIHAGLVSGRERGRWWGERARRRLIERVAAFDAAGAEIVVVFDGSHPLPAASAAASAPAPAGGGEPGPPRVVFAESADDWLVAQIRGAERPEGLAVVTRDRRLAGRVRSRGARVVSPRDFLARCGDVGGDQASS